MIDNIFIAGFLLIVLVVGFLKSKNIRNMRDFSVADRTYSLPIMVATMTATVIGGGATFGFISSVFTSGIIYMLISVGNPLNHLIIAQFFVDKVEKFSDCISVGDIMDKLYGKNARIVSGVCGSLYCAAAVGGQVSAIGFIVQYFLNVPYLVGVLIGCGAVIAYSSMGGIKAVTATDILQFSVLIIAIPMVCNIGLNVLGGYNALFEKVPQELLTLPSGTGSIINYFFMFLAFSVPFLDPPHTQRLLMAKNTAQIRNTLRVSALVQIPFFICIGLIGLIAVATNPSQESNLAFPHLINTIIPTGLRGFAVAGLLSVVMSTADSYLNSAGITLVHDAIKPLMGGRINDENELRLTQIVTFFLGTLATIIAVSFSSIMSIIFFSLNFWGPIIVVPLYAAMLGIKDLSSKCFYAGSISGFSTFLIWHFFIEPQLGISSLIPSMIANAIAFFAAYYFKPIKKTQFA